MGVEYPPAIDMFTPGNFFGGKLQGLPGSELSVVDHKTACGNFCTATSVAQSFADPNFPHSTHFVVGRDGSVIQVVHLVDGAWGNCCLEIGHDTYWDSFASKYGNLNNCTISIEHEDWTSDNSQTMTPEQIQASKDLNLWLCKKFNIPSSHIKGHNSLDPISRARCPGPTYPMSDVIAYVEANLTPMLTGEPLAAFTAVWNSIHPGLNMNTGIANFVQGLFNQPGYWSNIPGAPTGPEFPYTNGRVAQNFQTGLVIWDGSAHLFLYK